MTQNIPQCILPWLYLEIFPDGIVTPCCANELPLGNIKNDSIEKIWNNEEIKNFRKSLLDDNLPDSCKACKKIEELGGVSLRKKYNSFFEDYIEESIENTNQDGSLKTIRFRGWDFKVSNKCNFKCLMCSERLSSSFTGKILHHSDDLNIDKFLEDNIEHLKLIEFAGGETLLMDEQYDLLERLISLKRTDIELWYNTNMSVLTYKGKNILDYWSQWDPSKLTVFASIDEIGTRAEIIRKGTKWDIIDKNLKILTKQAFNRSLNITVSALNISRIPEIIEYLLNINYIHEKYNYNNFEISLIDGGLVFGKYSLHNLSEKYKNTVKEKLILFIKDYNVKYNTCISKKFYHVLNCL